MLKNILSNFSEELLEISSIQNGLERFAEMWKRKAQVLRPSAAAAVLLSSDEDVSVPDQLSSSVEFKTTKRQKRSTSYSDEDAAKTTSSVDQQTSDAALLEMIDEATNSAERGEYESALGVFERILAICPDHARAHEMKAQVLMELERDYVAVRAAEQAVRCAPVWFAAHRTLARAQLNVSDLSSGVNSFVRAVHLCPWDGDLRTELRSAGKLRHHRILAGDGNPQTSGDRPLL